jgi:hypothetical protein
VFGGCIRASPPTPTAQHTRLPEMTSRGRRSRGCNRSSRGRFDTKSNPVGKANAVVVILSLREVHSRMPAPVWGISWTDRTRIAKKRICCGMIWPLAHVTLGEFLSLVSFHGIVQSVGRQVEAFKTLPVEPPTDSPGRWHGSENRLS